MSFQMSMAERISPTGLVTIDSHSQNLFIKVSISVENDHVYNSIRTFVKPRKRRCYNKVSGIISDEALDYLPHEI
jgi:hypothetical protein